MDLDARKYHIIQELFSVNSERILDALERVLKFEKEQQQEITTENKKELDNRLESYKNNPKDILDWEAIKRDW